MTPKEKIQLDFADGSRHFVLMVRREGEAKGAGLLAVYSAGLGIPFLIAALMIEQFSALFARMKGHLVNVERAMGVLMVITGIGFLTGAVTNVSIWLLETFPALQTIG